MEEHQCQHLLSLLSDYVDGEARADVCAEIERHLESCDNCRIVVDSLRKTISMYQTEADTQALPGEVRERLYRCLDLDDFLKP